MNDDYGNTSHSGNSRARPFSPWQGGEGGRRPDEGANIAAIQKFPLTLTLSRPWFIENSGSESAGGEGTYNREARCRAQ